jgi:hypothetical protein
MMIFLALAMIALKSGPPAPPVVTLSAAPAEDSVLEELLVEELVLCSEVDIFRFTPNCC